MAAPLSRLGGSLVLASDADVVTAAAALLARGNAVDAVAGGVFAASGLHASVLLGPVQLLVAGAGAGLRAIDGRVRQPGLGNRRPRGFLAEEEVPPASRVGVPALPAALAAAVSTYGRLSLGAVVGPGVELARGRSPARAAVLDRIARRGPPALVDTVVSDELVAAAGRMARGLLSKADLEEVRPDVAAANARARGANTLVTVPWGGSSVRELGAAPLAGRACRVLVVADRNGLVAIACYAVTDDGVSVEALDLVAPLAATPVMRGKTRVKPGEPRSAAAPLALLFAQREGVVEVAAGVESNERGERLLGAWLDDYQPESPLLRDAPLPEGLLAVQRAGASWAATKAP